VVGPVVGPVVVWCPVVPFPVVVVVVGPAVVGPDVVVCDVVDVGPAVVVEVVVFLVLLLGTWQSSGVSSIALIAMTPRRTTRAMVLEELRGVTGRRGGLLLLLRYAARAGP